MKFSRMLQVPSTSVLPGNWINQSKQIQLSNGFINLINCVHISLKIAYQDGMHQDILFWRISEPDLARSMSGSPDCIIMYVLRSIGPRFEPITFPTCVVLITQDLVLERRILVFHLQLVLSAFHSHTTE